MLRTLRPVTFALAAAIALAMPAAIAVAAPAVWERVDVTMHSGDSGGVMIVAGTLPAGVSLPAKGELSAPAGSVLQWLGEIMGGDPSADPELRYTKATSSGSDIYSFTLTKSRTAQLEVPVPGALVFDGQSYTAKLRWTPTKDTREVNLSVAIPQGAKVATPVAGATLMPADGTTSYYTKSVRNAKAGRPLDLSFSYFAPPAAPAQAATATQAGPNASVIVLGVLALALGALAVFMAQRALRRSADSADTADEDEDDLDEDDTDVGSDDDSTDTSKSATAATDLTRDAPGSRKRAVGTVVVLGIFAVLTVAAVILVQRAAEPEMTGDKITKTYSTKAPCTTSTIRLNLAGTNSREAAERLFTALGKVKGIAAATVDVRASTVEAGYCESEANEQTIRDAIAPTGLLAEGGAGSGSAP